MWWSGRQIVAVVVDIRRGIGIVVVKRRDAGRRVQREFWEGDCRRRVTEMTQSGESDASQV